MSNFINVIESSLLADLVCLYRSDLKDEEHEVEHHRCLACSKMAIIRAIKRYRKLDKFWRQRRVRVLTINFDSEQN
jgi:hypothetical protein